jgi:hypothetical protein
MIRTYVRHIALAAALAATVTAGAQTAAPSPATPAATTDAATPAPSMKSKASAAKKKATVASKSNPTVCAHLPPDDRAGCMAKKKTPAKTDAALTKSASGAGGGGGSLPRGNSGSAKGQ